MSELTCHITDGAALLADFSDGAGVIIDVAAGDAGEHAAFVAFYGKDSTLVGGRGVTPLAVEMEGPAVAISDAVAEIAPENGAAYAAALRAALEAMDAETEAAAEELFTNQEA